MELDSGDVFLEMGFTWYKFVQWLIVILWKFFIWAPFKHSDSSNFNLIILLHNFVVNFKCCGRDSCSSCNILMILSRIYGGGGMGDSWNSVWFRWSSCSSCLMGWRLWWSRCRCRTYLPIVAFNWNSWFFYSCFISWLAMFKQMLLGFVGRCTNTVTVTLCRSFMSGLFVLMETMWWKIWYKMNVCWRAKLTWKMNGLLFIFTF